MTNKAHDDDNQRMKLLLRRFHPRNLYHVLREIDEETERLPAPRGTFDTTPAVALLTTAVCLLFIHYMKFATTFQDTLESYAAATHKGAGFLLELRRSPFFDLYANLWWGFIHLLGYVVIPALVIKFVLKQRVMDNGLRLERTRHYIFWYVVLAAPIVCFAYFASFSRSFLDTYPFYRLAFRSGFDLLAWEAIYLSQFVFLEFFFRGFLLHACRPAFGANAVFVMCVPYLMIHFAKPWPEAAGAILFGLFLGILALRSRSIWGGAAVHMTVALSMDMLALLQRGRLPTQWWPT
jgi:membrane protease YdiL (CAAX protease family)